MCNGEVPSFTVRPLDGVKVSEFYRSSIFFLLTRVDTDANIDSARCILAPVKIWKQSAIKFLRKIGFRETSHAPVGSVGQCTSLVTATQARSLCSSCMQ
jgi:hypothetical protein